MMAPRGFVTRRVHAPTVASMSLVLAPELELRRAGIRVRQHWAQLACVLIQERRPQEHGRGVGPTMLHPRVWLHKMLRSLIMLGRKVLVCRSQGPGLRPAMARLVPWVPLYAWFVTTLLVKRHEVCMWATHSAWNMEGGACRPRTSLIPCHYPSKSICHHSPLYLPGNQF